MEWHVGAPATVSSPATINHQLEFALSILHNQFLDCVMSVCQNMIWMWWISGTDSFEVLPASLVLTPLEGALGSPVPIALLATTLNSYSTQGLSSTAMADSMSPVTGSGSGDKSVANQHKHHITAPALQFTLYTVCKTYTALSAGVQL